MNTRLRTFHIHGELGKRYQPAYSLAVDTITEGVRAICIQVKGFSDTLKEGEYMVFRGNPKDSNSVQLHEGMLALELGKVDEVHIIPVARGSKRNGIGKIILGIALFAAAFFTAGGSLAAGVSTAQMQAVAFAGITYGQIAMLGVSLILSGISQLLTPVPGKDITADENPSFLFDGPFNTSNQGVGIPLIYGIYRAGSIVASAGITSEVLANDTGNTGEVGTGVATPDYTPFDDPYYA